MSYKVIVDVFNPDVSFYNFCKSWDFLKEIAGDVFLSKSETGSHHLVVTNLESSHDDEKLADLFNDRVTTLNMKQCNVVISTLRSFPPCFDEVPTLRTFSYV